MGSFGRILSVTRVADGGYSNGRWANGATTSILIRASVQPATPEDLQALPEGRRLQASYRLYTTSKLRSAQEDKHNPDVLTLDGDKYEVSQVSSWQNNVIPHYKVIITRISGK